MGFCDLVNVLVIDGILLEFYHWKVCFFRFCCSPLLNSHDCAVGENFPSILCKSNWKAGARDKKAKLDQSINEAC